METIGLDRVCLSSLDITYIDMEKLKSKEKDIKIVFNQESKLYGIQSLTINDNKRFSTLRVSVEKRGEYKIKYCRLELSLSFINADKSNLYNMRVENYLYEISLILEYIESNYGIHINADRAIFYQMEINCNIMLSKPFREYEQLLELMMYNLSNRHYQSTITEHKYVDKINSALDTQTYCRGNRSMQIQIYDKKKQLESCKKYVFENPNIEIMRIEIKLLSSAKIKQVFHTNSIWRINSDQITSYYFEQVQKLLLNKLMKWKKDANKRIQLLIKEKQRKTKNWIIETLQECVLIEKNKKIPVIFDIDDYINIVNEYENNGHKSRNDKKIKEYNEKYANIACDNNKKFEEIQDKLLKAYEHTLALIANDWRYKSRKKHNK